MSESWGPFLESPGNLPDPISVFGGKCFLLNKSQFLLALNLVGPGKLPGLSRNGSRFSLEAINH